MHEVLVVQDDHDPLPVQLLEPWLKDNENFLAEMTEYADRFRDFEHIRKQVEEKLVIKNVKPVPRSTLGAVDAANCVVSFGDRLSILVQAVKVNDDGQSILAEPKRFTGINNHDMSFTAMPVRTVEESKLLAAATEPVIADMSYWTFLIDVNTSIERRENMLTEPLNIVAREFIEDGVFMRMIENRNVIPMTKTSGSETIIEGISDRQALTFALKANEYSEPRLLVEGTRQGIASFGIRGFTKTEANIIKELFLENLGVVFYKPHPWSRAYRIEGHIDALKGDNFLLPLLAAISHHTTDRLIIEPWPQFMADFMAKKISGLARLYGQDNVHRYQTDQFMQVRTEIWT